MVEIIAYHKDCPDGFCAAFIAKKKYPTAKLVGMTHGMKNVFDAKGKNVLMVDFSLPREEMKQLYQQTASLIVLDHHATAEKELEGLPYAFFDMKRSGAGLAWDMLFDPKERPWFISYVEDRDLWNNRLPKTKEVNAYLMSLPHTMEGWSEVLNITGQEAAEKGKTIRIYIDHYIEKILPQHQVGTFFGHSCGVLNMPYMNISEALATLIRKEHFEIGLAYFERKDGHYQFSLRSVDVNVSAIAKEYGGGGQELAAGFDLPYEQGRYLVDDILHRNVGKKYPIGGRGQADLDRKNAKEKV